MLPFFSHIADMPGLACLNHLSTGVKSKSSPECVRDCTTAARVLRRKAESAEERKAAVQGATAAAAGGPHQRLLGTRMCAAGSTVTNGGFCSPLRCFSRRGRAPLWLREQRLVWRGIPRMSAAPSSVSLLRN